MPSKPKVRHKGNSRPNGRHVITLRIDEEHKEKLHALTLARSAKSGRNQSYNQTILELIEAAR